ncbi:MAG: NUDIX domain-containing protein [Burkholderiales bacterium]|nr:NUDIX domain-containing protein [Burkholderiales bacterium]
MGEERKVEVIGREIGYQGFFRLERVHLRHSLHRGGMSPVLMREILEKGNVVAMLPYDPIADMVVMIEQFRVGAIGDQRSAWLLEIVAGLMEPGEQPEEVARREATEEAGLAVRRIEPIARFFATPAKSSELTHLFCGEVDASGAGGVHGLAHEGEDIRVIPMPAERAFHLLEIGRIDSAWPMIALMWLQTHRERLRRDWSHQGDGPAGPGSAVVGD